MSISLFFFGSLPYNGVVLGADNLKERGVFLPWKKLRQRKRSIATLATSMARLSYVAMGKRMRSQSKRRNAARKKRISLVKKRPGFSFPGRYLANFFLIASKVSSDKSCSILQASRNAVSGSTPRSMKILLRILCLSYIFSIESVSSLYAFLVG